MHEEFIRHSIALAQQARDKGNHPFGALLVKDGEVILTAENTVNTGRDTTHHAELNLVSQASQVFDTQTLSQSILYTSTEPCAMCAGAIYWAGIRSVVFGCSNQALLRLSDEGLSIACQAIFATGIIKTEVIGPVLEQDALSVHTGFWDSRVQ